MEASAREIWNKCLDFIKDNIHAQSYKTWFLPIIPLNVDKNILTIQVPSPFFYEYLEEQYLDILSAALKRQLGANAQLEYRIIVDSGKKTPARPVAGRSQGTLSRVTLPISRIPIPRLPQILLSTMFSSRPSRLSAIRLSFLVSKK